MPGSGKESDSRRDMPERIPGLHRYPVDPQIQDQLLEILDPEVSEGLEISERLKRLSDQKLGRAFIHRDQNDRTKTIMAYVLPSNREQTRHVVIFNDGNVFVTEPDERWINSYQPFMEPSETPFLLNTNDVRLAKRFIIHGSTDFKPKVVLKSTTAEQFPLVQQELNRALFLAQEIKEESEIAAAGSPKMVIEAIDSIFPKE